MKITPLNSTHWQQVEEIYLQGIATGNATFETQSPGWEKWSAAHPENFRFVSLDENNITGFAALSPVSARHVYRGVAEVMIYVHEDHRGKGIGKELLSYLINKSEELGMWTLTAGIFPENIPSIELHKKLGFREVGYRERIGEMNGVWRNTILLERRSKII